MNFFLKMIVIPKYNVLLIKLFQKKSIYVMQLTTYTTVKTKKNTPQGIRMVIYSIDEWQRNS